MFSLFLQLCLAAFTFAAPIESDPTFTIQADAWQYGTGGGILGFIVLVIDVLAWSESLWLLTQREEILTLLCSGNPQIEPPPASQDPLVCPDLHPTGRRCHHLLALCRPSQAQQRCWIRAYCLNETSLKDRYRGEEARLRTMMDGGEYGDIAY